MLALNVSLDSIVDKVLGVHDIIDSRRTSSRACPKKWGHVAYQSFVRGSLQVASGSNNYLL